MIAYLVDVAWIAVGAGFAAVRTGLSTACGAGGRTTAAAVDIHFVDRGDAAVRETPSGSCPPYSTSPRSTPIAAPSYHGVEQDTAAVPPAAAADLVRSEGSRGFPHVI